MRGVKATEIPQNRCAYCGALIARRRLSNRYEAITSYMSRRFCDRTCMAHFYSEKQSGIKRGTVVGTPPVDTSAEHWREIPTHPGYYASNLGRIWSSHSKPSRVLKQRETPYGYMLVRFVDGNQWVHRMVLEAFAGERPDGFITRHLDGNKLNNSIENLCWGTHLENSRDMVRHGTVMVGESNHAAKITEEDVRVIRRDRSRGVKLRSLELRYGLTRRSVLNIIQGKTWKHVE